MVPCGSNCAAFVVAALTQRDAWCRGLPAPRTQNAFGRMNSIVSAWGAARCGICAAGGTGVFVTARHFPPPLLACSKTCRLPDPPPRPACGGGGPCRRCRAVQAQMPAALGNDRQRRSAPCGPSHCSRSSFAAAFCNCSTEPEPDRAKAEPTPFHRLGVAQGCLSCAQRYRMGCRSRLRHLPYAPRLRRSRRGPLLRPANRLPTSRPSLTAPANGRGVPTLLTLLYISEASYRVLRSETPLAAVCSVAASACCCALQCLRCRWALTSSLRFSERAPSVSPGAQALYPPRLTFRWAATSAAVFQSPTVPPSVWRDGAQSNQATVAEVIQHLWQFL